MRDEAEEAGESKGDSPTGPPLAVKPCRTLCSWQATPASHNGLPLFACRGCGSQWTVAEPWTPIDADGRIPPAVREARLSAHAP